MKKILSLFLSLIMLISITAGIDLSAYADDVEYTTISTNGTWYEGYITDNNTSEWYKITIPSDGEITVKLMHYMGIWYGIYNSDFSEEIHHHDPSNGTINSPVTETYSYSFSKGIYYVQIAKRWGGSNGKYKIMSTFKSYDTNELEPNDFENAMTLVPNKEVTGAITHQDSVDWYRITIPCNSEVTIKLKHYVGIWYGIYNSDLSQEIHHHDPSNGSNVSPVTETYNYSFSKGIYYIQIARRWGGNNGKYKLSWNMNVNVSKPNDFRVSARSTEALKLAWNKVSGVSGYQLQRKSGNSWKTVANTTATSCTVKSLKAGTAYTFRVRAYKTINGAKYYSGWRTLTTPTKPATVSFSSLKSGKKKFTAKWKKTACTGYQIQYSTSSKFKSAKTVTVGKNSTTSKTVTKLKAKKKYYVRVRAYKTVNGTKYYGAWSKTKTVKTKK